MQRSRSVLAYLLYTAHAKHMYYLKNNVTMLLVYHDTMIIYFFPILLRIENIHKLLKSFKICHEIATVSTSSTSTAL